MPDLFFSCSLPGFYVLAMACLADKDWFDLVVAIYDQSICLSWRIWKSNCYGKVGVIHGIYHDHTYIHPSDLPKSCT